MKNYDRFLNALLKENICNNGYISIETYDSHIGVTINWHDNIKLTKIFNMECIENSIYPEREVLRFIDNAVENYKDYTRGFRK